MSGIKRFGFGFSVGLIFAVGALQAQEPALNIQAPATAPVVTHEVVAPVITEVVPVVPSAPAPVATNVPLPHVAPVAVSYTHLTLPTKRIV